MKNVILTILTILYFGSISVFAQVVFQFSNNTAISGTTVQVPIAVTNFQNVVGAQFTLDWDDTMLTLIGSDFHPVIDPTNPEIGGNRVFLWENGGVGCQTIPDGENIMTLTFQVIGAVGNTPTVSIDNAQTIEVVNCALDPIPTVTTSTAAITILPPPPGNDYGIPVDTTFCQDLDVSTGQPRICIPLEAFTPVGAGIIGMDFCMDYDENLMSPTGIVHLGDVVLNGSTEASTFVNYVTDPGKVHVSVYYTAQAPFNTQFVGDGEIACVEFLLNSNVTTGTVANFGLCNGTVTESYLFGASDELASNGNWTLLDDEIHEGRVIYWDDDTRPISYDPTAPTDYLLTSIDGVDATCGNAVPSTTPDLNGYFEHNINNGWFLSFDRDIAGDNTVGGVCPTNVMPYINGIDCYWAGLVTTFNNTFVPNPYQMVAMDVNMDDRVTAGDITLIQNRIIQNICEYPQAWNYPAAIERSKDWRFVDQYTVQNAPDFEVSTSYPTGDGSGYNGFNVPDVPECLEIRPEDNLGVCSYIDSMVYSSILLGDVNGTWQGSTTPVNIRMSKTDEVTFNACSMAGDSTVSIAISFASPSPFQALDFTIDYDEANLELVDFEVVYANPQDIGVAWNNQNDERVLFTSYSKAPGGINTSDPLYNVVFKAKNGSITESDLGTITAYFNGNVTTAMVDLSGCSLAAPTIVLNAKALFQTVYEEGMGLMKDDLRQLGFIPTVSPYATDINVDANVLLTTGVDAIVDWVLIELRDPTTPTTVLATQSALIQRDGDIVTTDGVSDLSFEGLAIGNYHVVIRHRNHLGVMTAAPVLLDETVIATVDFTMGSAYGTNAMYSFVDGTTALYSGDANGDGSINAGDRATAWNERNQSGYLDSDCNLDGSVNAADRATAWNNRNLTMQLP